MYFGIMIISDTSALVLNWTSKDLWKSKQAKEYFASLDLSAGDALLIMLDETEHYMHMQAVTNRKYFMRKFSFEQLNKYESEDRAGQVVILGAGISPLSLEIASMHPLSQVFDVDKYLMADKERYLAGKGSNIQFIDCDITDVELLKKKLIEKGWAEEVPTILVMEGIIYYIRETDLRNILTVFATADNSFACDFGIKPELVNEKNRIFGTEVFRKITEHIGIPEVSLYNPGYFLELVKETGFKQVERSTLADVQLQRTGSIGPFEGQEPGWIALVAAS
jgi:O-methyltransferase involved in polyketide biosynthesis